MQTHQRICSYSIIFSLLVAVYSSFSHAAGSANPALLSPGWQDVHAENVAPSVARAKKQLQLSKRSIQAQQSLSATLLLNKSTEQTTEIQALARGFRNNPNQIFEFVRNHIDYTPTFGSMNSATDTLLARRGNDWDQASLLIAILRAAGFTANYKMADVTYNTADLANWLGVDNDLGLVLTALANGGIPSSQVGATNTAQLTRVWVEAVINGNTVQLDPAMVAYQEMAGLNLSNIISYNSNTFVSNATAGATVAANGNTIEQLNRNNIRNDLTTFSVELINHIRTQIPTAKVDEIIGGRQITAQSFSTLPTAIPLALAISNENSFADVDNAFRHTLRLQYEGIDQILFTDDLHAQRLSLDFNAANQPELKLGGVILATGNVTTPDTDGFMQVTIDHPYAAAGGSFADQSGTMLIINGAINVVLYDFNHASPQRFNHFLRQAQRDQNPDPLTEATLGADLQLLTQLYIKQQQLFNTLVEQLSKVLNSCCCLM